MKRNAVLRNKYRHRLACVDKFVSNRDNGHLFFN